MPFDARRLIVRLLHAHPYDGPRLTDIGAASMLGGKTTGRIFVTDLNRRLMLAGAAAAVPALAQAQNAKPLLGTPRSVITEPPRDFGPGAAPAFSPDPDVLRIDPSFGSLLIGQEVIRRLYTGLHLAEGPAWSQHRHVRHLQRRQERHALSLYLGDGRGHGVPPALLLHQRQQLRSPGPPAFHPGFLPPRGALGSGRLDDGAGRSVRRQAAQLAQ